VKGKLGRVLFRKIGGRIIPIRISNIADKIADSSRVGLLRTRNIIATGPKKEFMGQLTLLTSSRGKAAYVQDVRVPKEFRRKSISKNLFARATQFLERTGAKFLRSDDLQHPAQIKIRNRYGFYKVRTSEGKIKLKNRTRFFADQFGPFKENTRRVSWRDAIEILKRNLDGRQITATTMLRKRKK
jgi:hypothetical protein